jgi:hypothetical protein
LGEERKKKELQIFCEELEKHKEQLEVIRKEKENYLGK